MDFLDIDMSKEEQLSFFANNNQRLDRMEQMIKTLTIGLDEYKSMSKTPDSLEGEVEIINDDDDEYDDSYRPKTYEEIADAAEEFVEKIWFDRHLSLKYRVESGIEKVRPDIWAGALKSAEKVIEKYGEENLGPYTDFEWYNGSGAPDHS